MIHYHCPCCIKHSETTIQEIEQHYRHCVSTMSNQNALFTSICKHDEYITFQVIALFICFLFVDLFVYFLFVCLLPSFEVRNNWPRFNKF